MLAANNKTYFCPECAHKPTNQRFIGWAVNNNTSDLKQPGDEIKVTEDKTLDAQYADLYHIDKDTSVPNGDIDVSKYEVDEGEMITVTAFPHEGYKTAAVTVRENNASGEELFSKRIEDGKEGFSFSMPASDIYITAEFETDKCYITGASLSLGGDIGINIYFNLPEYILNDSGAYLTMQGPDDTEPVKTLVSELEKTKDGYPMKCTVKSAQMAEEVSFILYNGQDENIPLRSSVTHILSHLKARERSLQVGFPLLSWH